MKREVRDQEKLSFKRSFEFCLSSIRHRFFRSVVTLSVIVLAVAFLMNILTETIIAGSVARGVQSEFEKLYIADLFEQRIAHDVPLSSLVGELSRIKPYQSRWKELERWSGLGHDAFVKLTEMTRSEVAFNAFFEALDFGRRRRLVKRSEGPEIFEYLSNEENLQAVAADLRAAEMAAIHIPGDFPALAAFVKEWHPYRAQLAQLHGAIGSALQKVDSQLNMPLAKALDTAAALTDPAQIQTRSSELTFALTDAGFEVTADEIAIVRADRHRLTILRKFREYIQDSEFRGHWTELKIPSDFTPDAVLDNYHKEARVRKWVADHAQVVATRTVTPLPVTRDELAEYSQNYRSLVQNTGRSIAHLSDGEVYKSERQKKFIAYIDNPQFAETWKSLAFDEEFSREAVLWRYLQDKRVRGWLFQNAAKLPEPLPCGEDDMKSLAEGYLRWIQKRGLQKVTLDSVAENDAKLKSLVDYLKDPEFKSRWDELGIVIDYSPAAVMLYATADDKSPQVVGYIERIARNIASRPRAPLPATETEILTIAEMERDRARVHAMQAELTSRGASAEGISERTFWLIAVSFLVCVVGIANAMLMAVTERFREIATMKCLGALDEFIMIIFLIESGLQGLIGGVFGVLLGLLLAVIRCGSAFGWYTSLYFPVLDVLKNIGVSTAAGMLLAMLAAVYPAWVASRMAPMEAMRVE
jgi:hypothetical protein